MTQATDTTAVRVSLLPGDIVIYADRRDDERPWKVTNPDHPEQTHMEIVTASPGNEQAERQIADSRDLLLVTRPAAAFAFDTDTTPGMPPHRAAVIASIHAYAQWLADNPDVPAPTHLDGTTHLPHEISDEESVEIARRVAANHDGTKHTSGNTGWVIAPVLSQPIKITHTVFCNRDRTQSENWL